MTENEERFEVSLDKLERANQRLKEALSRKLPNQLERDGIIQRFEFTVELAWKTIQAYLQKKGIDVGGPKNIWNDAFESGVIDNIKEWKALIKARNQTSHIYDEDTVEMIYKTAKEKAHFIDELITTLKKL